MQKLSREFLGLLVGFFYSINLFAVSSAKPSIYILPTNGPKVFFESVWKDYKKLSSPEVVNFTGKLLNAVELSPNIEQTLAQILFFARWSRIQNVQEIDQLNKWQYGFRVFETDFRREFLTLAEQFEATGLSNSISTVQFVGAKPTPEQLDEIFEIVKLIFTYMNAFDQPKVRMVSAELSYQIVLKNLAPFVRLLISNDPSYASLISDINESYVVTLVDAFGLKSPNIIDKTNASLVAHLTMESINKVLGLASTESPAPRFDVIQQGKTLYVAAFGIEPLGEKSQHHPFGFYYKLTSFKVPKDTIETLNFSWAVGAQSYEATVEAQLKPSEGSISNWDKPIHRLANDGKLVGMVIISPNMKEDIPLVEKRYSKYLEDQNFSFDDSFETVLFSFEDVKNLFINGGIDYFVKEAHSNGDTINLLRISSFSKIRKAVKRSEQGRPSEIFYILSPSVNENLKVTNPETAISLHLFGEWMRRREMVTREPILYVNASCYSIRRVITEISQIHSPYLINIPSIDRVQVFNYRGYNHARAFIEGIRSFKEYSEIRQLLKEQDYHPETLKIETRFLFPDQLDYQTQIVSKLGASIDYKITIRNPEGVIITEN